MQPNEAMEALRILLVAGFGLTALLAFILMRTDSDANWHRRYFDEHPPLRQAFDTWRRKRHRELMLASGRCPEHNAALDSFGRCAFCHGRPEG